MLDIFNRKIKFVSENNKKKNMTSNGANCVQSNASYDVASTCKAKLDCDILEPVGGEYQAGVDGVLHGPTVVESGTHMSHERGSAVHLNAGHCEKGRHAYRSSTEISGNSELNIAHSRQNVPVSG